MSKAMGMMSGVYFVGRAELLEWVNDLLKINYTKVEDMSNGAAFCQIIDAIHPGTVHLKNVKFDAVQAPDIINNYKVLQEAFDKNGIKQYIDVNTLVKGKYMASLELFQWIHGYYSQQQPPTDYDPVERRRKLKLKEPTSSVTEGKPAGMAKRKDKNTAAAALKPGELRPGVIPGRGASAAEKHTVAPVRKEKPAPAAEKEPVARKEAKTALPGPGAAASAAASKELAAAKKKIEELNEEVTQANEERDFYYDKLRKIETFCQDNEDDEMVKKILAILYEADEEKGFVAPNDDDEEEDE